MKPNRVFCAFLMVLAAGCASSRPVSAPTSTTLITAAEVREPAPKVGKAQVDGAVDDESAVLTKDAPRRHDRRTSSGFTGYK